MSLASPTPPRKFALGIICSRSFDDPSLLDNLLGAKLESIGHVYSTGALPGGKLVEDFARANGLDFTVYPSSRHAMASAKRVIEASQYVFIIADVDSKIAAFAENECALKRAKVGEKAFGWRKELYEPFAQWRSVAANVSEILAAVPADEIDAHPVLKAISKAVK